MSDQSVKDKTVKGIGWSALENFLSQGVTFVVGIVLARLLSPDEFGTIGVAMIFVALFNKIVDCGFSNALIRKQNVSRSRIFSKEELELIKALLQQDKRKMTMSMIGEQLKCDRKVIADINNGIRQPQANWVYPIRK